MIPSDIRRRLTSCTTVSIALHFAFVVPSSCDLPRFSFLFSFKIFFISNPSLISQGIRTGMIYMEKADGSRWIHAKFVRFCSNFMNVSRSPVPDDAVSGEN